MKIGKPVPLSPYEIANLASNRASAAMIEIKIEQAIAAAVQDEREACINAMNTVADMNFVDTVIGWDAMTDSERGMWKRGFIVGLVHYQDAINSRNSAAVVKALQVAIAAAQTASKE